MAFNHSRLSCSAYVSPFDFDDDDRLPGFDREPTTLETFSRTIRNYVPSSIPIPTAAPTPPRVSRPVSFGSFLTPSTHTHTAPTREEWKRRGSETSSQSSRGASEMPVFSLDDDIPADERRVTRYPGVGDTEEVLWAGWDVLADVAGADGEPVKSRSVLMVGYPRGLQIWDCANLGSVGELLNLTGAQWGAVEFAGVLPDPPPSADDAFRPKRPLIGFSSRTAHGTDFLVYSLRTHEVVQRLTLIGFTSFAASSQFIILCTSNPATLHIISACTLSTLYTIPSASLVTFTPSPYTSSTVKPNANIRDVLPLDIDQHYPLPSPRPIYALSNRLLAFVSPLPRHDSAPSSTTPGQAHTSLPVTASDVVSSSASKFALPGMGMSQADLGNAALKIGGSVFSGMKTLGGMAFSAARAGVTAAVSGEQAHASIPPPTHGRSTSTSGAGSAAGALGMFFSKSAPAATHPHEYQTAADRRRRSLRVSSPVEGVFDSQATVTPNTFPPPPTSPVSPAGCNVTVVDLNSLWLSSSVAGAPEPETVAQFTFSKPATISGLKFSADGMSVAVCSKDGHAVRVLQLRPTPKTLRQPPSERASPSSRSHAHNHPSAQPTSKDRGEVRRTASVSSEPAEHLAESMQHVYTLRRGRTSAVVEGMEWAHDKLWFGMSTRKRTVHVFAVNPLGGRPDGSSHLAGKVVNSPELVSTSTELSPLVRVRLKPLAQDAPNIPCAFTFLHSSEATLPQSLLPPASVHFSASSSPSSVSSTTLSKPVSPAQRPTRPTNYKDLLVFDPNDGTLTLHRIYAERPPADQPLASIPVAGGMSISLPGMSTLSRMSASPPAATGTSPRTGGVASGLTQMMERSTEMVGRENVVGTWSLARGRDWPEVRQSLRSGAGRAGMGRAGRIAKADWLSRAELSTFSTSPRILPRLIYLSHQFSFHALGEDYHALIRSSHFDVPSSKIEVRKPIEVSAFASGDSDAFVQALPAHSHHSITRAASSFDEPLASALTAQLHPLNPSPPVLPMLPNGAPKSRIGAIPIRQVAAGIQDGMSEGLVRIRREFGKARSPKLAARRDEAASSVPLEFDEEDEDFLIKDGGGPSASSGVVPHAFPPALEQEAETEADVVSRSASTSTGTGTGVVSTPSTTNMEPLPAEPGMAMGEGEEDAWSGWGLEEQQAVEDAERFDDITVGFMDEEHETMRERETQAEAKKGRKRRGRRA
ncbi:hypothetical protein L226DRAFT_312631 [Lentinus tigrinus ALCF2SS1-7]|uniref:BCAS3 WD40 domain-containing protein n=1 Tax=Lentinus tigrinus ALCF2SS1-6 TaxID=1328759 RepID=A0A5C2RS67_9APHY|nr:hypothetical protein L227DRAFT_370728 [Lentinus tigrinus ALCF2SS1-6]RPD68888.1 hypothetical protein L226DRAFT_312631 [Lentinus tigrinus ALCF2SS1-7]